MKLPKLITLTVLTVGLVISGGIVAPRLSSSADNSQNANICDFDLSTGVSTPCPVIADPAPPPDPALSPEQPPGGTPGAQPSLAPLVAPAATTCH